MNLNKYLMASSISLSIFEKIQNKTYSIDNSYLKEYEKLELVLDKYLHDIIIDITREIDNISEFQRNSIVITKKNPRLLSKYINKDININLIKCEINKLAQTNFNIILETVINIINTVDIEKVNTYIELIFTSLINKCYMEENYISNYIKFIIEIGKLEKYNKILILLNSFINNIVTICNEEIIWIPGIKTESGINSKLEYYSTIGRFIGEMIKLNLQNELLLVNLHQNMILTNTNADYSQEKRILIIIGFSQIQSINKYIPENLFSGFANEMKKIIESKIQYKFKYRMMDWYESIKNKSTSNLEISNNNAASEISNNNSSSELSNNNAASEISNNNAASEISNNNAASPTLETSNNIIDNSNFSNNIIIDSENKFIESKNNIFPHVQLHTRISSIIAKDINTLIDSNIITKVCKYIDIYSDTNEFSDDIKTVLKILINKINQNINNTHINIITEFIQIINKKYDNIWNNEFQLYFNELSHFNSININWQNNGLFLVNLLACKIITWNIIERIILINKKDTNKIVELKFRIITGINMIGIKKINKIIIGSNITKYLNNMNTIITRINSINSNNPLLYTMREFVKSLEKQLNNNSSNRFELLRSMMCDIDEN